MPSEIKRLLKIDAGHRVFGHESKCKSLHGHEYFFEVFATAPELDSLGRVVDFSVIKTTVGNWLDQNWDHGMILWEEDPVSDLFRPGGVLGDQKCFFLPYNPTAENLSKYLLPIANDLLKKWEVTVTSIICQETSNCSARWY